MASIFKYRRGWRAQANVPGRPHRDFHYQKEAEAWARALETEHQVGKQPRMGGPTRVTLAEMFVEYARHYTVAKDGRHSELNRINHYLRGAGLPLLRIDDLGQGQWAISETSQETVDAAVAKGWRVYLASRRAQRERTYSAIAELARRRVSTLLLGDFHNLMATMAQDGLSASTIQKEIALLRAMFNVASTQWHWVGFTNPCVGLKLGHSTPRFVNVSREALTALYQACAECDNVYVLPLVDCAIFLTARQGSLLELRWEHINFENRNVWLRKTKVGPVLVPMSQRTQSVLEDLPRHPSGRVFPMTANAVTMAWEGVRAKAGLPALQFRDLRHIGGTHYAKFVPNAHVLREILGHKTLHQAQVYVNLASDDVARFMDAAGMEPPTMPPAPRLDATPIGQRKAKRLNRGVQEGAASNASSSSDGGKGNVIPLRQRTQKLPKRNRGV